MSGASFGVGQAQLDPNNNRAVTVRELYDVATRKADRPELQALQAEVRELREIVLRLRG